MYTNQIHLLLAIKYWVSECNLLAGFSTSATDGIGKINAIFVNSVKQNMDETEWKKNNYNNHGKSTNTTAFAA